MGRESRISSEQRWAQLTEALIELGRNVKILQARIEALETVGTREHIITFDEMKAGYVNITHE